MNYKKLAGDEYSVICLLCLDKTSDPKNGPFPPIGGPQNGEMKVVTLSLSNITQISSARVFTPQDLIPVDNRQSVLKSINQLKTKFNNKIPLLDPVENMKIKDSAFLNAVKQIELCEKKLSDYQNLDDKNINSYQEKVLLENKMKLVKQDMKKMQSLLQMEELGRRKRVLRRLGYCTSADVIEMKGRVACEITR